MPAITEPDEACESTNAHGLLPVLLQLPPLFVFSDGSWGLPTSESMITSFLDTLTHCHYDLYWCWENTGLRGNFALDFANTWDAASGPAAAAWSATQEQWSKALAGFEGKLWANST